MKYRGREIDVVGLWSEFVDFPAGADEDGEFLPLVKCPNPDHVTEKRHFQINRQKPLVHCFAGCGISGTYESAIMLIEGCKRAEARRRILRHSRVTSSSRGNTGNVRTGAYKKKRKSESTTPVPDLSKFSFIPQAGVEYLAGRGVSAASIAKWELGWNSESLRITIPVRDKHGHLKWLIERAVKPNDHPKYLYPEHSDKSSLLFGTCHLDLEAVRSWGIIVVEGSLDCIRIDQHSIGPVVGILGSVISGKQTEILASLRPKRVFSMFDMDAAGFNATFHLRKNFRSSPLFVCRYPRGLFDPAELSRKEASRVVDRAIPFSTFNARASALMK